MANKPDGWITKAMNTPDQTFISPDGALTLSVYLGADPTVVIEPFGHHIHGDQFISTNLSPHTATEKIVAMVLNDTLKIASVWSGEILKDRWIIADPLWLQFDFEEYVREQAEDLDPGQRLEVRSWTGR